ncbi:MAG: hypothetical protein QOJ98_1231 [Acidobacteriota bacterium]|nr:hypothetical protein [Acidobacteriota bacterium]
MNIDYTTIEDDLVSGTFRQRLEEELTHGFRQIHQAGERLPTASHYAAQIAEIVNREVELGTDMKYNLYQEVLLAVEAARTAALGDATPPK